MPDRIVTASAADGSFSIVAGITTGLVREAQRRHNLWPTASAALGRLMSGATLLGAGLKGRERVTLQVSADGPLDRLVADAQLDAPDRIGVRGHVRFPAVDVPLNHRGKFDVGRAVGRGFLQVTRSFDVGQPYVGIVELVSGEIGDDIASYLAVSEQIPSIVALGVLANPEGIKAAGGVIAQVLPGSGERTIATLEHRARSMPPVTTQIAAGATAEDLAHVLSAGLDMRAWREYSVAFTCTCSAERVSMALQGLGADELRNMAREQPETEAICEFCGTNYVFAAGEIERLARELAERSSQSGN